MASDRGEGVIKKQGLSLETRLEGFSTEALMPVEVNMAALQSRDLVGLTKA